MQRQQERARPHRPKLRRAVGELLTAWLILVWGVVSGGTSLPFALITFREGLAPLPLLPLLTNLLILLQTVLCIVSGLCMLLRLRLVAKYGLMGIALCFLSMGAITVTWVLLWTAICVVVAVLFFFLGRWIGQQEESEGQ